MSKTKYIRYNSGDAVSIIAAVVDKLYNSDHEIKADDRVTAPENLLTGFEGRIKDDRESIMRTPKQPRFRYTPMLVHLVCDEKNKGLHEVIKTNYSDLSDQTTIGILKTCLTDPGSFEMKQLLDRAKYIQEYLEKKFEGQDYLKILEDAEETEVKEDPKKDTKSKLKDLAKDIEGEKDKK